VFSFEIQATCPHTGARAGILHTAHGDIETPVFMPVGTQATVKGLLPRDLINDLDAKIILGNTYHLYLRPGHETIRQLGGLHKFMNWPRAILTDSGGFQVFSLSGLRKITEEGVMFQSHLNGDRHMFTPESTIDVQLALGSDIMMVLDECLEFPASHEAARVSMERTIRWARAAYAHYRAIGDDGNRACFPIVQGSMYPDLRRACAEQLLELNADGYAIGGLSVGEARPVMFNVTEETAPHLPAERPRYFMGIGDPEAILRVIAAGIDMFDCVLPTRLGRTGSAFTWEGRLNLRNARFARDGAPLDEACTCSTCTRFSRAYLRHLVTQNEVLALRLLTVHNLSFLLNLTRDARDAIRTGGFAAFLDASLTRLASH